MTAGDPLAYYLNIIARFFQWEDKVGQEFMDGLSDNSSSTLTGSDTNGSPVSNNTNPQSSKSDFDTRRKRDLGKISSARRRQQARLQKP
jgi:hypothetical protein